MNFGSSNPSPVVGSATTTAGPSQPVVRVQAPEDYETQQAGGASAPLSTEGGRLDSNPPRGATMSHSVAAPCLQHVGESLAVHRAKESTEVGMESILNANIFNMHGLENVNVPELRNIKTETKCDAFFMLETWHGPDKPNINSVVGKLRDEFQGWNLVGVECPCIPHGYVGAHGEIILSHPDLNCISCHEIETALPELNHRMLATQLSSGGYKFRVVICHLKAGSVGSSEVEAQKYLQLLAAMQYFDEAEDDEILIFAGDVNTHVQSGFWSQLAEPFYENGFTCPSKTQIYDVDPINSWTHIPTQAGANRNMLEQIFIKNPFNLPVEVKLLDIKLTSDHPRFLNLKIYGPDHPPIEIAPPAPIEDHFKFKCLDCKKGYATQVSFNIYHEVCPYYSIDETIAIATNTQEVDTDSMTYVCEECPFESKTLQNLIRHVNVHIYDPYHPRPIKCNHCSARYTRQSDLTNHLKLHKIQSELLKCEDTKCPFECDKITALRLHKLRAHTGDDKPYKCTICSASYSQRAGLITHMCHHGIDITTDLYKCDNCNYSGRTSGELERHNLIHGRSGKFKCTKCNATFDNKTQLSEHAKYH